MKEKEIEKVYKIREVCQILSVSRQTVYKWLAINTPEDVIIPPVGWFRLPAGHIRIHGWVIKKIQNGEL
jgi:predicted site-specific integrase-resolvase